MLALRGLANLFTPFVGKATMQGEAEDVVKALRKRGASKGLNKNGKVALATVALKYVSCSSLPRRRSFRAADPPGGFVCSSTLTAELTSISLP